MEMKRSGTIKERLREAMDATGKKQVDLVRETGLDPASISSYLSGKYEPKQKAIGLLAKALDVDEMWLWGYDVPQTRSIEQKRADDLVQVISLLRRDEELLDMVGQIAKLTAEQRASIKSICAQYFILNNNKAIQ